MTAKKKEIHEDDVEGKPEIKSVHPAWALWHFIEDLCLSGTPPKIRKLGNILHKYATGEVGSAEETYNSLQKLLGDYGKK